MASLPFEISVQETQELIAGQDHVPLIDCREEDEFAFCRIEGAILIPLRSFPVAIPAQYPDRSTRLLVYCHHGMRSGRAVDFLRSMGYENSQSVAGGIEKWSQAIDPSVPRY